MQPMTVAAIAADRQARYRKAAEHHRLLASLERSRRWRRRPVRPT